MQLLMKFLLLASLAAISGCSRPPDLAAEQERLLARDREWATIAAAGQDVDRVASY